MTSRPSMQEVGHLGARVLPESFFQSVFGVLSFREFGCGEGRDNLFLNKMSHLVHMLCRKRPTRGPTRQWYQ